mgnify:CR=1 FL=1
MQCNEFQNLRNFIFGLICTKNSAKIYAEIVDDDERATVIVLNSEQSK